MREKHQLRGHDKSAATWLSCYYNIIIIEIMEKKSKYILITSILNKLLKMFAGTVQSREILMCFSPVVVVAIVVVVNTGKCDKYKQITNKSPMCCTLAESLTLYCVRKRPSSLVFARQIY